MGEAKRKAMNSLQQIRLNLMLSFFQQHKEYPDTKKIEELTHYIFYGPSAQPTGIIQGV
jgi:hypothetical protein